MFAALTSPPRCRGPVSEWSARDLQFFTDRVVNEIRALPCGSSNKSSTLGRSLPEALSQADVIVDELAADASESPVATQPTGVKLNAIRLRSCKSKKELRTTITSCLAHEHQRRQGRFNT